MKEDNSLNETSLDTTKINSDSKELTQQLLDCKDLDKVKELTALFNLNAQKKSAVRILKMNNLLDKVTNEIIERFDNRSQTFTNDDLLKYMQAVENSIDKSSKTLGMVEDTPAIQYQQNNQVNIQVNEPGLNRDSRQKVLDAVNQILQQAKTSDKDIDIKEITNE